MDLLYIENYFIFAVFITFFLLEVGIALLSLASFDLYMQRLKRYLVPIWEIDGTFAIFYIVNLEASYPNALGVIGSTYVIPALCAGLFIILRNAFIAYSELSYKSGEEKSFLRIYALSTLVIAVLAVTILSSTVSGIGVSITANTFNWIPALANGFNLIMLVAAIVFGVSSAMLFFGVKQFRLTSIAGVAFSMVLVVTALYLYVPVIAANIMPNIYLILVGVLAFCLTAALAVMESRYTKYLVIITSIVLINVLGQVQYPYLFNGALNFSALETNSAISGYVLLFTTAGGLMVLAFLLFLMKLSLKEPEQTGATKRPAKSI
jgi:cytochrome bd ubiquinol oxidase subunit II